MSDRLYFPLFVDLTGKNVLVVGAGKIACRRIGTLLPFGPRITVVAPETAPEIAALAEEGGVVWLPRTFQEDDLDGMDLVLTAAGNADVDALVASVCRERHIPVNAASDKSLCDFYFPGIARKDRLVVGITASGADHKAARQTTEAIRRLLDEEDL